MAVDRKLVIEMYQKGLEVSVIAEEVDASPSHVYTILHDANIQLRRKSSLPPEIVPEVIQKYTDGFPVSEILRQYGTTYTRFYQLLSDNGIQLREVRAEKRKARDDRLDKAVEMYKAGHPIWKIVDETGIAQPILHRELHLRDVPLRRAYAP